MGTSKGYGMPTGGDWRPLKREATRFAKEGESSSVSPARLVRDYLMVSGGAHAFSRGKAGGGRDGRAARDIAKSLGGFLSSVASAGLDEALREIGLEELVGHPAEEISIALLNSLSDPANTLDQHAARLALAKLNDELLQGAESYEDVARRLSASLDQNGLRNILASFFGYYLFERFCRDFYEDWVRKVGSSTAGGLLKSIKDCIKNSLQAKLTGHELSRLNWRGREGTRLAEQVMSEILEIYEVIE
jgi:hypothetical protein